MAKTKFLIALNKDGNIDAKMHGDILTLASAIVDVMEQNEPIRQLIITANVIYKQDNN